MTIYIVPATVAHAEAMAGRLRAADSAEIAAAAFMDERTALVRSVEQSMDAWTALEGGKPIAMWGVGSPGLFDQTGRIWLLTCPDVERHRKQILRQSRAFVARARGMFLVLENVVDARYAGAVRLLRWLGFTVFPPQPYGPNDAMFCYFRLGE